MRVLALSLVGVLVTALTALSQPAAPPMQTFKHEDLATTMQGWEKAMADLRSLVCVVQRKSLDKALDSQDDFRGFAMFFKATGKDEGNKARLELVKTSNPKFFEKYISTGADLHEYMPAKNVIRVHKLPKKLGGDDGFLSFFFGMNAAQAKERYQISADTSNPPDEFHYIMIEPKHAADKGEFVKARLSLYRTNHMQAQLWYLQPNGNEITWNFTKLQINVQIPGKYFEPEVPSGWTMEAVRPGPIVQGKMP